MKVYFATLRCGPSDVAFLKKKKTGSRAFAAARSLSHMANAWTSPPPYFPLQLWFPRRVEERENFVFSSFGLLSLSLPSPSKNESNLKPKKKNWEGGYGSCGTKGKEKKKKWERENENFTLQNVSQRRWEGTTWGWPVSYSKFNTRVHTHRHTTDRRFFFFFLEVAFSQEKSGQPKRMSTSFYFWKKKRREKKEINNKIKKKRNT